MDTCAAFAIGLAVTMSTSAQPAGDLPDRARAAAARATDYFRSRVATRGGYLWRYSADLQTRFGEGRATETQIWVQPPGTPAVGMAYLRMHEATGDDRYLDGGREAAEALVWGQLASGGWTYRVDFEPQGSRQPYYRRDQQAGRRMGRRQRNVSTFDDDTSQAALRLLMRVDRALDFKHDAIHDCVEVAIGFFLSSQYPNGAWPQGTDKRADASYAIRKARYPESWSRTPVGSDYWFSYTLNDNVLRNCVLTMLEAHEIYGRDDCLAAAKRGGDFLILAQMPDPQPAWAQQYNVDMEPIWARKFEPPAISGGESAGAIRTLVDLFVATGESRFLEPLPAAIRWYRASKIDDSRWARFYELRTNRPLYFTRQYELVYTDDDLPTHYGFQGEFGVEAAIRTAERALRDGREPFLADQMPVTDPSKLRARARQMAPRVESILAALDNDDRWIDDGWIQCRTFVSNLHTLADYLQAIQGAQRNVDSGR